MSGPPPAPAPGGNVRSPWVAVALPSEHGGWGLTLEPALLGLLVSPSWAGAALAGAALLAFLVRTPIKVVLVDRWRHRWLARTGLAARIAAVELAAIAGLAVAAGVASGWSWLVPVALALPLVAIELWFDMRSRGRRMIPELTGACGIAAVAAAVALAGGEAHRLAFGLWVVVAARAIASIPFVRVQIDRLRYGAGRVATSDQAQLAAVIVAASAVALDVELAAGLAAIVVLALLQLRGVRTPPPPVKVLGIRQMLLGLGVVVVAAVGVLVG